MDKYLKLIIQEESKIEVLKQRKKEILNANKNYSEKRKILDREEENLHQQKERYQKIKYYLENSKSCRRGFLKKAVIFGIKCSASFVAFVFVFSLLMKNIESFSIFHELLHFLGIGTILGIVEYKNVSRECNQLLKDYCGNIEEDLKRNEEDYSDTQKEKEKIRVAMQGNSILLQELETVLKSLVEEVSFYRTTRNNLIEKVLSELDEHIKELDFPEIDIQKLIEKKIH